MTTFIRIPHFTQQFAAVDKDGRFNNTTVRTLNDALTRIETAINAIADIPEIQVALADLDTATSEATAAAAAANAAAEQTQREAALVNSYVEPDSVITASTTTITIAGHTRHYADGTSVAVSGGSVPATGSGDIDYVSYSDPARTGGTVAYAASTISPTQTGSTHVIGAVTIPSTGTQAGGSGPRKPGFVDPLA